MFAVHPKTVEKMIEELDREQELRWEIESRFFWKSLGALDVIPDPKGGPGFVPIWLGRTNIPSVSRKGRDR